MNSHWQFTRLSGVQIKQLCAMASKAQKAARARFDERAEVDAETWRKWGQDEATGVQGLSLRKATQVHYLPIRGFWWNILGNYEQAFTDFLNSGPQNEKLRNMKWRLAGEVARLAEGIQFEKSGGLIPAQIDDAQATKEAWNYTRALCSDKFQRRRIEALEEPDELKQLCDTVFNRASAKLGKGHSSNRNKSQRRKSKAAPTASEEAVEPLSSDRQTKVPVESEDELMPHAETRQPLPF